MCIRDRCPTDYKDAFISAVERASEHLIDGNALEPLYIRKPQAERDLEQGKI